MLLYITLFGFIVTFILFVNLRQSNKANQYLFFFFLINNVYALTHYATIDSQNEDLIAIMLVNFSPVFVLTGPALYFYVRGLLRDDFTLRRSDLFHFIPFFIYFINISGYLFSSYEHKLEFARLIISNPAELMNVEHLFIPGIVTFLVRPVFAIGYVLATAGMVFKYYRNNDFIEKQHTLIYKWLSFLLVTSLIIYVNFLLFSLVAINLSNYEEATEVGRYFLLIVLMGVILLNISLLFFPNILYGLPQLDYPILASSKRQVNPEVTISEIVKKQPRSFEISEEKLALLKYKIDLYIEKKPYLNPEFNLTTMSSDTDIPIHHLSYYLNEHLHVNFNTWKNDLKITQVIKLIQEGSGEILTLDALAKQAGFGSRTSFFNSFKQKMGITPSEYLNKLD
jgi:AraC-like DNA-binding protein